MLAISPNVTIPPNITLSSVNSTVLELVQQAWHRVVRVDIRLNQSPWYFPSLPLVWIPLELTALNS